MGWVNVPTPLWSGAVASLRSVGDADETNTTSPATRATVVAMVIPATKRRRRRRWSACLKSASASREETSDRAGAIVIWGPDPRDSWQTLDDLDHFFSAVTLGATEIDEISNAFDNGDALWCACHCDPPPSLEVEQPFFSENVEGTKHRVLVDAKHGSEVLGERKPLARTGLTLGNGPSNLSCHLVVQSEALAAIHLDIDHGTSNSRSVAFGLLVGPI